MRPFTSTYLVALGKTFVINLLLAEIRSEWGIALAVVSSGIVATLLACGRTAQAYFKVPLNIIHSDSSVCNITKQSSITDVLRECKLTEWDENSMAHRRFFEAISMALKDIRCNNELLGCVSVLLAGDFRLTLRVVPGGHGLMK